MIHINVLPHHLRPIKRTPLPHIISVLVFVLVAIGVAGDWIKNQATLVIKEGQHQDLQAELGELDAIIEESNRLEQMKLNLADKIETIDEIVRDRIIWSRELYNLSRLLPENMWLRQIEVTTRPFLERVPQLDPKTGAPMRDPNTGQIMMKEQRVDRPILRASGYVTDSLTGSDELNPLLANVTTDQEFADRFTLEPPEFSSTTFEGFDVKSFSLDFLIETGGGQ